MHETDLEALFVADAVAALRAHGWQIVPIDEAYRDPIAAAEPDSPYLATRIGALASLPGQPPRDALPANEPRRPGHRRRSTARCCICPRIRAAPAAQAH